MGKIIYSLSEAVDGASINGQFNESCKLILSDLAKDALKSGRLKIIVERHGGVAKLENVIIEIGAKSGMISISIAEFNTKISIGDNCFGKFFISIWGASTVNIDPNTSSNGCRVICDNGDVHIGEDCMIADHVIFQCGDQHGIVNVESGDIVNADRASVKVGEHVWLARQTTLLNSSNVLSGSVVGLGSVVSRGTFEKNSILLGIPAKVVRNGFTWSRSTQSLDNYSAKIIEESRLQQEESRLKQEELEKDNYLKAFFKKLFS
ncbi:acyltransferase [Glaciecola sp. 1036]|uniref:acyltransferase n=1 Tax=Alteromonadaceae TaxID=72275 RepID=UPI003D02689D